MSNVVIFKTPKDPIDLIIPTFFEEAIIYTNLRNTEVNPNYLQDITLSYYLGSPKSISSASGIFELKILPEKITIKSNEATEEFLEQYNNLKKQGYCFDNTTLPKMTIQTPCLSVHFMNEKTGQEKRFISATTKTTRIDTFKNNIHQYPFKCDEYIKTLKEMGLKHLKDESGHLRLEDRSIIL